LKEAETKKVSVEEKIKDIKDKYYEKQSIFRARRGEQKEI
jgi:hypothetical protein